MVARALEAAKAESKHHKLLGRRVGSLVAFFEGCPSPNRITLNPKP